MPVQFLNIVLCMILCYAAWGGFFLIIRRRGVDFSKHFLWTAFYFLVVAIAIAAVFWGHLSTMLQSFTPTPFVILALFMAGQALLYVFLPRYLNEDPRYYDRYPDRDYLKLDWRRLVSKSMDILAQQVFIMLLVLFLRDAGLSLPWMLAAFTMLFALLHIPLIASEWGAWPSWLFGAIVVVFGVFFPIVILTFSYGFVYTFIIHWLFYTLTAIIFWGFAYDRRPSPTSR